MEAQEQCLSDLPWVIVELRGQSFAISTSEVQEMLTGTPVAQIPEIPDWVRGVINLRGRVIPLVDLRKRLGRESALEEVQKLSTLLEQREQDHRNWLAELESSAREGRKFALATDPHKCAFGKWYDSYKSSNLLISELLKKLDEPHRAIHALAAGVIEKASQGRIEEALGIIEGAREGALSRMIQLLTELRHLFRECHREVFVVLAAGSRSFAVAVDSVIAVERLDPASHQSLAARIPGFAETSLAKSVAKRKTGELVLTLESKSLLPGLEPLLDLR